LPRFRSQKSVFTEGSKRALRSLAVCLPALTVAAPVLAQTKVDPTFSVERFQSAPGPRNYLVTRGARTDGEKAWSAALMLHYAYRPFVVESCTTNGENTCDTSAAQQKRDVRVVENLITADLMGSFTVIPRLQLGLRLPVSWAKGQGITREGLTDNDGLSAVGIGDPELEGKARVYGEANSPFVLGVAVGLTAPLGSVTAHHKYIGDRTPTAGGRVIIDGKQGPLSYAVNLGGMFRDSAAIGEGTKIGSEGRYSAAVAFQVSPVLRALVDVFGSTRFSTAPGENTFEALAALQAQPMTLPMVFTLGAGSGLVKGVGSPDVRAVLGAMYVAESRDDDHDGIENHADQCPTEPEDKDGYEDTDGCPDKDNDLDAIPDAADKCPMQAEDVDGFEDADGCPELDNDKDGLPDTADQCPNQAESKNGYKDEDGCPDESDVDNDGVPDAKDKCPNEPEDTDGFEDTDGCPDPDNDKDGVLDDQDECVDEPETVNGFQDEDGCPDEAPGGAKKKR
jgi:OOP family OmpA-OmpF porin